MFFLADRPDNSHQGSQWSDPALRSGGKQPARVCLQEVSSNPPPGHCGSLLSPQCCPRFPYTPRIYQTLSNISGLGTFLGSFTILCGAKSSFKTWHEVREHVKTIFENVYIKNRSIGVSHWDWDSSTSAVDVVPVVWLVLEHNVIIILCIVSKHYQFI